MNTSKQDIRKNINQKLAEMSDKERRLKSRDIVKNFFANIPFISNKSIIAGYVPSTKEVNISLLLEMLEEEGCRLCLPVLENKTHPMSFLEYKKGTKLEKNEFFDFLQPPLNNEELIPDIIIVPLVAFDSSCNRLGKGGGCYDRTLEHLSAHKHLLNVGVAYALQQVAYIKREKHDIPLDAIVTEKQIFTK